MLQIDLVANDEERAALAQHPLQLDDPILDAFERVWVGDVIDEKSAIRATVINWPERVILFLASKTRSGKL